MPRSCAPMIIALISFCSCSQGAEQVSSTGSAESLPSPFDKLLPLHVKLGTPQPGEWLAEHDESGQTYGQYIRNRPVKPDRRRRTIYVQPLGEFSELQTKLIDITAAYMGTYFDLPVRVLAEVPLSSIPAQARRTHPTWGDKQILTTYILNEVLRPRMPRDACVYIAFTTSDLWAGKGWNFVFGQASLRQRVGVWSIYRNGDPAAGDDAFRLCLRRTLKTATHETGHMFSMAHCTLYECNMCGSNHRAESDSHPLALCPHCLAKLCHATGADPEIRFKKLIAFCKTNGLEAEQAFWQKSLAGLE